MSHKVEPWIIKHKAGHFNVALACSSNKSIIAAAARVAE